MNDIVPELLNKIRDEFDEKLSKNPEINSFMKNLKTGKCSYKEASRYSEVVGEILAGTLRKNVTSDVLPDGKMYYNIAKRLLDESMGYNHQLISSIAAEVQTKLNKNAGINIKGLPARLNQGKIDGLVELVTSGKRDISKGEIQEEIINFSQSVVDDTIKANAAFHYKAGLEPKIIRKSTGHCCDWCEEVAGIYEYPDVPKDVYRRHRFCRCTVEYVPDKFRRQNVHTKNYYNNGSKNKLQEFRSEQINKIIESRKTKDFKESKRIRRILSAQLVGEEINGVEIKEITEHISERMVERNIKISDFIDGFKNPLEIGDTKLDSKNRASFKVISEKVTFYINPEKGSITTIHKTGSSKAKKLKEKK